MADGAARVEDRLDLVEIADRPGEALDQGHRWGLWSAAGQQQGCHQAEKRGVISSSFLFESLRRGDQGR